MYCTYLFVKYHSVVDQNSIVRIENDGLGFYFMFSHFPFIFSYFSSKEYKTKKTKCDTVIRSHVMVTSVTCSHNIEKGIEGSGTRKSHITW